MDLLTIATHSIELLEKAAAEADALEAQVEALREKNKELETRCAHLGKQASSKLDRGLLLKVAGTLESGGMLSEGMTAEKLASLYEENPNRLADIALRLLCPVVPDGQPIGKAANLNSPGTLNTIHFNGREVIDHDGWVNALR